MKAPAGCLITVAIIAACTFDRARETGDTDFLDPYRDVTVGGYAPVTDPDLIEAFCFDHGHAAGVTVAGRLSQV